MILSAVVVENCVTFLTISSFLVTYIHCSKFEVGQLLIAMDLDRLDPAYLGPHENRDVEGTISRKKEGKRDGEREKERKGVYI